MNKHHRTLELDRVLEMLAEQATCAASKELALRLEPCDNYRDACDALQRTADINTLTARYGTPGLGGIQDCTGALQRAKLGSRLSAGEILQVARVLRTIRTIKKWRGQGETPTAADDLFHVLAPVEGLEKDIFDAILSEEEIADTASPALNDLRRRIRKAQLKVREQLDGIIRSPQYAKALQEPIITMRDGRFVVPVKIECKNEVKGLVHDTSSSGATVFIEPMAVVDANNEIRMLQNEEQMEIDRILQEFSERIGQVADATRDSFAALLQLDLLFAKSRLADKMKATVPDLNEEGIIEFRKARHPLINKEKVVPVDIRLGDGFDTLVITGPNTGGKTVALKTLGLLTLMAACGMMLPVATGSRAAVFTHVLADIGDEQSIEQSLSTFSSHIVKIIEILKIADTKSLVLTDELGAGTDPTEGAALAVSIITALRQRGARLAATTHYAELKIYALETPGVVNASCEFDVESLAPTYKLSVGVPGKSNAFLISAKLGIPESVIDAARNHMSNDDKRLDSVLAQLDDLKLQLKAAEDEAEKARYEAEHALESAEKKRDALIKQGEEELEATRRKAHELMQDVQNQAYALTDELRRIQKDEKTNAAARAVRAREIARKDTEQLLNRTEKKQPKRQFVPLKEVKPGQEVVIAELDQHAVVLSRPDKNGMVEVRAGILKTKVPLTGLCAPDKMDKRTQKQEPPRTRTRVELNHDRKSSMELNLLGYTVEEALAEVDRFLDHAMLSNQNTVYIIHGNGTGALRNAIQKHLRTHRGVKSFRLGRYGEGESGVTVVELK